MMKCDKVGLSFFLLMIVALVAGCGDPSDRTVATVGDYDITRSEFDDFTRNITTPFGSAQEEFDYKRQVLDTIITKRLLVQAAYEKGIDELEELARVVLANKDRFLLDILYQRQVIDKSSASEAEMHRFWEMLEYRLRFSHILVNSEDTAQQIVQRLMDGENFEQLAYDYSIDPSAKRNRGDLGYTLWGALVDEFQQAGFQMEPGEISPPVKSDYGYHIIKVTDKQINDTRESFDDMKAGIEYAILERVGSGILSAYMDSIKVKYEVTVDSAICEYIMHKRENLYPPQILQSLPKSDFDVEQLDRNERELVLATWDGGQITLFEYLNDIKPLQFQLRPNLDDVDSLRTIIFQMKLNDFLVLEANRAGYENDPEFKRKLRLFKELNMAEIMRNDSLPKPIPPDEATIRQYYQDNLETYSDPTVIQVFEILLTDEMMANQLAKEIDNLEEFKEKAMDLTERPAKRGTNGDLGYIRRVWFPEIFDAADKVAVGSIGGPVVNSSGKYSIFWIVDKIAGQAKDYLDVKSEIAKTLTEQQKSEALRLWVEARSRSTEIDINEDAIWETIDPAKYASGDEN